MAPPLMHGAWMVLLSRILFAGLVAWTVADLGIAAPPIGWAIGGTLLAISVGAAARAARTRATAWHRASRAVLGVAFIGERVLWAGADPIPMMAFVVLLVGLSAMHSLERVFVPVYAAISDSDVLPMVEVAAFGAYTRVLGMLALTFVVSLFLSLLVPLSLVRDTSLFAIVGLSVALVAVIALMALAQRPSRG